MSVRQYSPNVGRVKSCTGCRQVKLACDARKTVPEPCSRCAKKGMECRFDINFKRVPTRKLVAEMHSEIQLKRSKENTFPTNVLPNVHMPNASTSLSPSVSPSSSVPINSNFPMVLYDDSRHWLSIKDEDRSRIYGLGILMLDAGTIIELLYHFELYYIPHAVFLQPIASVSSLLDQSPLLFWTIVLLSCQQHDQYSGFYELVAVEIDNLLAPVVQVAIQDLETIHALLLLAHWPIPKGRQMHDPAGSYVALATNAAMMLNCHSPLAPGSEAAQWRGFGDKPGSQISQEAQALTWLACFVTGTTTATFQGFPPPLSSLQQLRSVDQALNHIPETLSAACRVLISIVKITTNSSSSVDGIERRNMHFSLTQISDRQLDELRAANRSIWTSKLEIDVNSAKLYLYGLTFTLPGPLDTESRVHRDTILHKALDAASALIAEIKKVNHQPVASGFYPCGMLTFAPKQYFTSLFNATAFLFRFLATDLSRTPSHENLAMNSIIEAHKIFQSFPGQRDHIRAAIHIEMFVDMIRDRAKGGPWVDELFVTNRLGASVMIDAAFRAGKHRNRDPATGESGPPKEWKSLNDLYDGRLPKAPLQKRGSQSTPSGSQPDLAEEMPAWWQDWDSYMDHFQVGLEQWPEFSMSPPEQQQKGQQMNQQMNQQMDQQIDQQIDQQMGSWRAL